MPPAKMKLHKISGKAKPDVPSTSTPVSLTLTPEQEEQFQTELYWCIKQLQKALSNGKLTNRQIEDHTKSLNTLMSNSAPIVKKKQVMRLSFGDYRTKMLEDEKKSKNVSLNISSNSKPNSKSIFLRKALSNNTDNEFKFNFPKPEDGPSSPSTNIEMENKDIEKQQQQKFTQSDNSFRFNFLIDDNNTK